LSQVAFVIFASGDDKSDAVAKIIKKEKSNRKQTSSEQYIKLIIVFNHKYK